MDEAKNPSEGSTAMQVEKASSVFAALEAEDDLVPMSSGAGRTLFAKGTGTGTKPATGAPSQKPKAKQKPSQCNQLCMRLNREQRPRKITWKLRGV